MVHKYVDEISSALQLYVGNNYTCTVSHSVMGVRTIKINQDQVSRNQD